jgi:hypothetical protein
VIKTARYHKSKLQYPLLPSYNHNDTTDTTNLFLVSFVPSWLNYFGAFCGGERHTDERDLQLEQEPVGESLCAVVEDRGRTDVCLHEVWPGGEFQEVVVQAKEATEGR